MARDFGYKCYEAQKLARPSIAQGASAWASTIYHLTFNIYHYQRSVFKNFFLVAWRNIRAQKTVSFINVFGLSIAIGICITVFLFLKNYWNLDTFHAHADRIFMVEYETDTDGQVQTWGDTPATLGTALANDFAQVERTVRVFKEGAEVFHKNNLLGDVLTYTDPGFFDMFTFPLDMGSPTALNDPDALVISSVAAQKYFGAENPIGRQLTLLNGNREHVTYTVQAVARRFPNNAGLSFSLLAGLHPAHRVLRNMDWKGRSDGIFVQLRDPADAEKLAAQLQPFTAQFNAANQDYKTTRFRLDNLKTPNPGAYDVLRRPTEAAHPVVTVIFTLVAGLMLALSCFNYVNIALGAVTHRLREIGVRKAIGGSRRQIIGQFMTENLVLVFFSLLAGLLLAHLFFIPIQNEVMVIQTNSFLDDLKGMWPFLIALLAFVALVSGAYPALYVSRFNTTAIFAGKQQFGEKSTLRRALLGTQFAVAYLAVIVSIVLIVAGGDFQKMPWGYEASRTLVLQLNDSTQFSLLKNELSRYPQVEAIAGASDHIGFGSSKQLIGIGDQKQEVSCYNVGDGYDRAMGLPLKAGRFFRPGQGDDNSVVVNEYFAKQQGWADPIGQTIRLEQKEYTIVGLMADVKTVPTNAPRPIVFLKNQGDQAHHFLMARFRPGTGKAVASQAEQDFQRLFSGLPVRYFFQNEIFDSFDRGYRNLSQSFGYIALLALLLACMGLYGLAAQHYARRLKEVSVRKLLGASVGQISWLVNRHFGVMLLLAGAITSGVCWAVTTLVLRQASEYFGTYHPGFWPFALANLCVLAAAAATIGHQTWQVSRVKLAETLKNGD